MRYALGVVLFLSLLSVAFGQGHGAYSSLGGYGNVLFPGTGHAPVTPPGGINGPNFRYGGGVGRPVFANPFQQNHPQHGRTVIVPYPVFYGGGYGYGSGYGSDPNAAYAPGYADQAPPVINSGEAPSVVINQNFIPQQVSPQVREYNPNDPATDPQAGMRLYQNSSHPYADGAGNTVTRQQANSLGNPGDQPTIYLIAFKDHSIVQALGYWMEGATLHYVSVEQTLNQVSISLIDRDLSQRLNDERGLEFKLPAAR
jgi:hypothetical protein